MSGTVFTSLDLLWQGLACAAITPGLRSVLVFDASPAELQEITQVVAQMLSTVEGRETTTASLGSSETDDDLWGSMSINFSKEKQSFIWQPGVLTASRHGNKLLVVRVPDLARLSLANKRACVTLVGEDVFHLERHGSHETLHPNICWVVNCFSAEVGRISPHLLDRFALRLNGRNVKGPGNRVTEVIDWVHGQTQAQRPEVKLPLNLKEELLKASRSSSSLSESAVTRIFELSPASASFSHRRDIALARLSVAVARFHDDTTTNIEHVDQAARILGMRDTSERSVESSGSIKSHEHLPTDDVPAVEPDGDSAPPSDDIEFQQEADSALEHETGQEEHVPPFVLNKLEGPYPEDNSVVDREAYSLRLPVPRIGSGSHQRGTIIGVRPAQTLQDLAITQTIFEAAKLQAFRRKRLNFTDSRLLICGTDLRAYRREIVPEQLLVLLLDYTCLRDCDWQTSLLPYLSNAYAERASICLIKVGSADAAHELRAERVEARNILAPPIAAALEALPGKSTPLAHGLELALQTLRGALQHGHSRPQHATLIVLSDGRGNIPLESSLTGQISAPVNRQGIEDSLAIARQISGSAKIKSIVLNPQPQQYAELPVALAKSLAADVENIPTLWGATLL